MSNFNWDDISINSENPETFFGKRHIKHERVYYDLMASQGMLTKLNEVRNENNKENEQNGTNAINDCDINKLAIKCEKQLNINNKKSNSSDQKAVKINTKPKTMAPPARPKAYEYADIYKKRKEIKAIEAKQNVIQPQHFKCKPLPTFYKSTKSSTNIRPNRPTVPITPIVLKRSVNYKKNAQTSK